MSQQKQNILIVETKDGAKYQGVYVSKDIQRQILILSNVKKTFQEKEEKLPNIEIEKDNISSINIVDIRPPKEDIHNFNEIPENKKNVVDENELANVGKAYDKSKDDFFDNLKPMTKPEAKKESNNYNKKNKDTFNLSENDYNYNDDNRRGWKNRGNRRGHRGGGRRGYGRGIRGGYNNNNFKNYQNKNNYGGNYNNEKQNYQGQNYYRGRGIRRRGRGRGNTGGYNKSQNNQYNNNEKNKQNYNNNSPNENNKENNQE